jgi:hypothetical protein
MSEQDVPERCEALQVGIAALSDDRVDAVRVCTGDAQSDGCAVVVDVKGEVIEAELLDEPFGDFGEAIEAVGEFVNGRHRRPPEADVIGRHQMVLVGQRREQIAEHVRTRWKAVQQ